MSDKKIVLALDAGTTSIRAILYSRDGRCLAEATQEFPQIYPQPGWVEHNPLDIWNTQLTVAKEAIARAGITAEEIAAPGSRRAPSGHRKAPSLYPRRRSLAYGCPG